MVKSITFTSPCRYQSALVVHSHPTADTSHNNPGIYCQTVLHVTFLYIVLIIHQLESLWEYLWPLHYVNYVFLGVKKRLFESKMHECCSAIDTKGQNSLLVGSNIKRHRTKSMYHILLTLISYFMSGSKLCFMPI